MRLIKKNFLHYSAAVCHKNNVSIIFAYCFLVKL